MLLPSIAIASALAASSHGTTSIQPPAPRAPAAVTAQMDTAITGIAQLVPASIAAPSAVFAVFGPALFRRGRPLRQRSERRLNLHPLPQNYLYFPAAR